MFVIIINYDNYLIKVYLGRYHRMTMRLLRVLLEQLSCILITFTLSERVSRWWGLFSLSSSPFSLTSVVSLLLFSALLIIFFLLINMGRTLLHLNSNIDFAKWVFFCCICLAFIFSGFLASSLTESSISMKLLRLGRLASG